LINLFYQESCVRDVSMVRVQLKFEALVDGKVL